MMYSHIITYLEEKISKTARERRLSFDFESSFDSERFLRVSLSTYVNRFAVYAFEPVDYSFKGFAKQQSDFLFKQITFVAALIYLEKYLQNNSLYLTRYNAHQLFAIAVLIATKVLNDDSYDNFTMAEVSSISLSDLNKLEKEFLFGIDFRVHISFAELQKFIEANSFLELRGLASPGGSLRYQTLPSLKFILSGCAIINFENITGLISKAIEHESALLALLETKPASSKPTRQLSCWARLFGCCLPTAPLTKVGKVRIVEDGLQSDGSASACVSKSMSASTSITVASAKP